MGQKNQCYQVRELSQLQHLLKRVKLACVTVSLELHINLLRGYYRMVKNPAMSQIHWECHPGPTEWPGALKQIPSLGPSFPVYKVQILTPVLL